MVLLLRCRLSDAVVKTQLLALGPFGYPSSVQTNIR